MFQVDHSQAGGQNVLLPEGEYEIVFRSFGESVSRSGIGIVDIAMVIRNDVEQQFKNKFIWDSLWPKANPTELDKACGGFSYKRIQQLSKAAGLPNGKQYANLAEWCEDFDNRTARVVVYHDAYEGKTKAKVKYYNETKFPKLAHVWKTDDDDEVYVTDEAPVTVQPTRTQVAKPVIDDDDVPF